MTISPGKSDIVEYYGGDLGTGAHLLVVQPEPLGLCDALFRALPLIGPADQVLVGLPDTVWFPEDGSAASTRTRSPSSSSPSSIPNSSTPW